MNSISAEKNAIRKEVAELKKTFSFNEKNRLSQIIFSKLERDAYFRSAKFIMAYWSMDDEVNTHDYVEKWAKSKTVILPAVDGNELKLKIFKGKKYLVAGQKYSIQEPYGEDFDFEEKIELVIVPGIAFDLNNNRLGRGKAYYDKLLKTLEAKKYGVGFSFQIYKSIPHDINDIRMDKVFSDSME